MLFTTATVCVDLSEVYISILSKVKTFYFIPGRVYSLDIGVIA